MYEHWSDIAMAHQCKSKSFDTVVGMQSVSDCAGAEVIRYHWDVLVLSIIHCLWSVVSRLKPSILTNSVQTVELVEHFDEGGITSFVC